MVAGRLQVKKGYYYVVLQLQDVDGKHYSKWISTGLKEKGNKKRAEAQLVEERKKYSMMPVKNSMSDMLFTDYMLKWLSIVKPKLAVTTYSAYESMVRRVIVPYFNSLQHDGLVLLMQLPEGRFCRLCLMAGSFRLRLFLGKRKSRGCLHILCFIYSLDLFRFGEEQV